MPLYEYQCEKCGRFERLVKFSDPPLAACPTCGGNVQKLFSSPAIQFKGSGWYITDYAKKSGTDAGKAGSSKAEGSEKSDVKSDSTSSSAKSESSSSMRPGSSLAAAGRVT